MEAAVVRELALTVGIAAAGVVVTALVVLGPTVWTDHRAPTQVVEVRLPVEAQP